MRLILISFVSLLLSGCLESQKLQADTEANFNKSYTALQEKLSPPERLKFDQALKDVVLIKVGLYTPIATPDVSKPSERVLGRSLTATFANTLGIALKEEVASRWSSDRAMLVVRHAQPFVHNQSPAEIIAIADNQKRQALMATKAVYEDQLMKAKTALQDAEELHKSKQLEARTQTQLIQKIEITKARFSLNKSTFMEQPTISFTIKNRGSIPVKRIYLHGKVETPGRTIPWIDEDFNYAFPGGLEPNETKDLNLNPGALGAWSSVPTASIAAVVMTIDVRSFEDASGQKISMSADDVNQTTQELRKAIDLLVQKLKEIVSQL